MLACLAITFSVASWLWLVPSPRWLRLRGRESEVDAAWDLLEVSQAEREKVEIEQDRGVILTSQVSSEDNNPSIGLASEGQEKSTKKKLLDIFSKDVRTRTAIAAFLMGMQQLSGIDGVLYVSFPYQRITT